MHREKQQDSAEYMETDARIIVARHVHPVELAIEHDRHPGERMPVARMPCGERPLDARGGEACPDHLVLDHVLMVVVRDELMVPRLPVRGKSHDAEKERDENSLTPLLFVHGTGRGSYGFVAWFRSLSSSARASAKLGLRRSASASCAIASRSFPCFENATPSP